MKSIVTGAAILGLAVTLSACKEETPEVVETSTTSESEAVATKAEEVTTDALEEAKEAAEDAVEAAKEQVEAAVAAFDPSLADSILSVDGFDLNKAIEYISTAPITDDVKAQAGELLSSAISNPALLQTALTTVRGLLGL